RQARAPRCRTDARPPRGDARARHRCDRYRSRDRGWYVATAPCWRPRPVSSLRALLDCRELGCTREALQGERFALELHVNETGHLHLGFELGVTLVLGVRGRRADSSIDLRRARTTAARVRAPEARLALVLMLRCPVGVGLLVFHAGGGGSLC